MGALRVNKLNKLLAYSSINHMGFLILSILVNNVESFFLYIFIYNIITITIFTILFSLIKYNNNIPLNNINQLIYLYKSNIVLSFSFILILFSLAGIPPLAGFFSKFILFLEAMQLN
jgi:NADH-quinone oxidoreductase subunit N